MRKIFIAMLVVGVLIVLAAVGVNASSQQNHSLAVSTTPPDVITKSVTYDDVLSSMHRGQWFGWLDSSNKNYANLIILDSQYSKPTISELLAAQSALQAKVNSREVTIQDLEALRKDIESRILAGTYTNQDLVNYLRILGGF